MGQLSLFDTAPRSASVMAESVCHMFYLDEKAFSGFMNQSGSDIKIRFFKTCAEDLVARFRQLNGDYIAAQQLLWKYALRKEEANDKEENQQGIKKAS